MRVVREEAEKRIEVQRGDVDLTLGAEVDHRSIAPDGELATGGVAADRCEAPTEAVVDPRSRGLGGLGGRIDEFAKLLGGRGT